ncbi:MAG: flavodoxin [Bacteroidales bacterium]|nr:flavodoxin [Bacteroidales bacterium]
MKKIGIFFGSTLGNTMKVAEQIQQAFGADQADLFSIEKATAKDIEKYDNLIFGTSTWGLGEMQEDWEKFAGRIDSTDLSAKRIALFGTGDQKEWADSFVNGLGALYHRFKDKITIVGFTPIVGYDFEISLAIKNNRFVGLAIDNVNQADLTQARISRWVEQLRSEFH